MSLSEQRYQSILSMLSREGTLRTSDLAQALNISDMTVRRDLMTPAVNPVYINLGDFDYAA